MLRRNTDPTALRLSIVWPLLVGAALVTAGCGPKQPFYFCDDGDLSHYVGRAVQIEYPDVEDPMLADVTGAIPPFSLDNPNPDEVWDLTLEEAVRIALENSDVIRTLSYGEDGIVDTLQRNLVGAPTVYDPALSEANPLYGVAAALAAFDAQFTGGAFWEKNDSPQNVAGFVTEFRPAVFEQDLGTFQARLAKTAATGGTWSLTHNVGYEWNNASRSRAFESDWQVNIEAEVRQPLLQGRGVQFNRIAGPGGMPGSYNGVMIARVQTDIKLADFEAWVQNMLSDVENAYWDLYREYHGVRTLTESCDRSLNTWRKVKAEYDIGTVSLLDEARARTQYFAFRAGAEDAQHRLFSAEGNLRFMMGVAATDGRLIRPVDEPTAAKVKFDWSDTHTEAMVRNVHVRQQKWRIKQRELELLAAKNFLLPRLDGVARYRWLGLGDHLIDPQRASDPFDNAYQSMTGGDFQEWQLGLELSVPLGFRREMAALRHAQLSLARERAVLEDLQLEVSHSLTQSLRNLGQHHRLTQTRFNQRLAAMAELDGWDAKEAAGQTVRDAALDRNLDAQVRRAEAEVYYYRSIVDYNKAITQVHFRKGSLLTYDGVYLAEGPWSAKAYFDATRRARARDAGFYLDYGFTRPRVISQGVYDQHGGLFHNVETAPYDEAPAEMIPAPEPGLDVELPPVPMPAPESAVELPPVPMPAPEPDVELAPSP